MLQDLEFEVMIAPDLHVNDGIGSRRAHGRERLRLFEDEADGGVLHVGLVTLMGRSRTNWRTPCLRTRKTGYDSRPFNAVILELEGLAVLFDDPLGVLGNTVRRFRLDLHGHPHLGLWKHC